MSIADEIQKLEDLRRGGALSEDEFARAKAAVLAGGSPAQPGLESHLAEVTRQNELARIDREWEIEREQYLVMDRFGRAHVPQVGGSRPLRHFRHIDRGMGVIGVVFGVIWTVTAYQMTRDSPFPASKFIFPAFGVAFILFGLLSSFGMAGLMSSLGRQYEEKAAKYEKAFAAYQERRRQVADRHDAERDTR